jgi:predicted SAM-dependent methyltransferase
MNKIVLALAQNPWIRSAASYAWMPVGSLKFRASYRKACQKGNVCLHVGSGFVRLDGWLNTDVLPISPLYLNAKRPLPMKDNTVSYIFGEHFINYVSRKQARAFFEECYRVLRPEGVLRIATIDIEALARAYLNDPESVLLLNDRNSKLGFQYTAYPIDIFNKTFFEDFNVCEYDAQTIHRMFSEAGFQNMAHCQVGASIHQTLSGVERHGTGTILEKFTCVVEGTKLNPSN